MLQWLPVTSTQIHHSSCTFISLHFCATSLDLLLAVVDLFQDRALLADGSHGNYSLKTLLGCSFCSVKWQSTAHQHQLRATSQWKNIHYWTDWHCKVTGRHVLKKNHLRFAIYNFTNTLLCYHTWAHHLSTQLGSFRFKISCFPSNYRGSHCFILSDHLPLSSLKTYLSKHVINVHCSENTYMTRGEKRGSLPIRQHSTGFAFMPLRVGLTVSLPTCLSASRLILSISHQTVCLWIKQLILHQDAVESTSGLWHVPVLCFRYVSSVQHQFKVVTVATVHSIDSE